MPGTLLDPMGRRFQSLVELHCLMYYTYRQLIVALETRKLSFGRGEDRKRKWVEVDKFSS